MPRKRKKREYNIVYFLVSFSLVILTLFLIVWRGKNTVASSSVASTDQTIIDLEDTEASSAAEAVPSQDPTPQAATNQVVWAGGRYSDQALGISLEIPTGWTIHTLQDQVIPVLEVLPAPQQDTLQQPENRVERVQIYRLDAIIDNAQLEEDESFIVLGRTHIKVAGKYSAVRIDTYSSEKAMKWYNTFILIDNKKIGFDFLDIGFFERPETQTMLNSIEFLE